MITVVPDLSSTPPRNVITISVSDPVDANELIQLVTIYRVQSGVRTALRAQPVPGSAQVVAYDYEAPYGVSVYYEWVGSYSSINDLTPVFTEDWTDLSAWDIHAVTGGVSWDVLTGQLMVATTGSDRLGAVSHALTPGRYRAEFDYPLFWDPTRTLVSVRFAEYGTPAYADAVSFGNDSGAWRLAQGGTSVVVDPGDLAWSVDFGPDAVTLTTTAGVWSLPVVATVSGLTFSAQSVTGASWHYLVKGLVVSSYGATTDAGDVSDLVALSPVFGWLIHPTRVNRSVEVDGVLVDVVSVGPVTNRAAQTIHRVIGAARPVVTANGPRMSGEFVLALYSEDDAALASLAVLLDDQTPILLNLPPAHGVPFAFVSVDDVAAERMAQLPSFESKHVRLPLIVVAPPSGVLAETGWSWASVAADFASWNAVAEAFASWNDVLLNVRR